MLLDEVVKDGRVFVSSTMLQGQFTPVSRVGFSHSPANGRSAVTDTRKSRNA
jgi:hypothetical protein